MSGRGSPHEFSGGRDQPRHTNPSQQATALDSNKGHDPGKIPMKHYFTTGCTAATTSGMAATAVRKKLEKSRTLTRQASEGAEPRGQRSLTQEMEDAVDGERVEADTELVPATSSSKDVLRRARRALRRRRGRMQRHWSDPPFCQRASAGSTTATPTGPAPANGDDFWQRIGASMDRKMATLGGQIERVREGLENKITEETRQRQEHGANIGKHLEMVTWRLEALETDKQLSRPEHKPERSTRKCCGRRAKRFLRPTVRTAALRSQTSWRLTWQTLVGGASGWASGAQGIVVGRRLVGGLAHRHR